MRLTRNQGKRMLKTASRWQHRGAWGEGLGCPVCNPRPWGKMRKQTAQNRAADRQMRGVE